MLELLFRGMANKEIYRELDMGFGTVKVYIAAILLGLGAPHRAVAQKVGAHYLQANKDEGPASFVAQPLSIC